MGQIAGERRLVLGAGMAGLAAGLSSGLPVYEAEIKPGGICSSYYVESRKGKHLYNCPSDGEAYRFEVGGGHWIFGCDSLLLRFIRSLSAVKSYIRRSAVYLVDEDLLLPYPIQNNLRYLNPNTAAQALSEMVKASTAKEPLVTMADWLLAGFGPTLCDLFFYPFHEQYTAGLWRNISPQDAYKSPVSLSLAIQGAFSEAKEVGYNATFVYPVDGLDTLTQRIASKCDIRYDKRVVRIDVEDKAVCFDDGSATRYDILLSTLPLNRVVEMANLAVEERLDPFTSVLTINIGATKGPRCPQDHWVYIPRSKSGFYRVGFYSNVDVSFLPTSARQAEERVGVYVEKAYLGGQRPVEAEAKIACRDVVRELQEWQWVRDVEVLAPTWIDVAYTWSWPGSKWKAKALGVLQEHDIYQVGRYASWTFKGIADSMRDGFISGAIFR